MQETQVQSLVGKIPWRREWQPTPVFLPGEFHGRKSLVGYSLWSRKQSDVTERLTLYPPLSHSAPVLLPGESHGRRSLVGCSLWGHEKSDTTEQLPFHFLLSCIGEGNGNPLQCSCLENPRDGGAWWAAVYGFVPSRTRLKQLSSSIKSYLYCWTFILYWFSLMMLTGWILMYILFNLLWVVFLAHVPWS